MDLAIENWLANCELVLVVNYFYTKKKENYAHILVLQIQNSRSMHNFTICGKVIVLKAKKIQCANEKNASTCLVV